MFVVVCAVVVRADLDLLTEISKEVQNELKNLRAVPQLRVLWPDDAWQVIVRFVVPKARLLDVALELNITLTDADDLR